MQIDRLLLEGFRNYDSQQLTFDGSCNVIYGENAQGKTNLLEAIVYLSCGRSPRTHADRELIGFNRDRARLVGHIQAREREFETEILLNRGRRRRMTVNGVAARNGGDLSQVLHTVFFSPEDLFLIREGAAARRRFMDQSLCQLRPRYAEALTEYGRLYDHKTRILRDSDEYPQLLDTLPDFNHRLCQVGAVLISYRARYVQALAVHAQRAHWECSGEREELALTYQTVKTVEDPLGPVQDIAGALEEHQARHYQAELASRLCLSGPHKDDIAVTVNGLEARHFCSQGQVRTAALSLKLADREIHKNAIGEYPVMLLDDVLSELDARRQDFVLNQIRSGQVLITFEKKINDKHLNVNVDMPEHPVYTMANPDYITQVIYNLIDNAVKFCPDGGNLGLRIKEGGSKAYVSVSNDGETIPPDELPLVFDRFHKLDKSRSQNRDGWGLGLYIVKTIVCSHGEDISVSSKDGKTEFTFTMPLVN